MAEQRSPKPTPSSADRSGVDPVADEARAELHQLREQAGGALSGRELAKRFGLEDSGDDAPPLDWRLTPRNVILQLAAIVVFIGVVWFLGALFFEGVAAIFGGGGS